MKTEETISFFPIASLVLIVIVTCCTTNMHLLEDMKKLWRGPRATEHTGSGPGIVVIGARGTGPLLGGGGGGGRRRRGGGGGISV